LHIICPQIRLQKPCYSFDHQLIPSHTTSPHIYLVLAMVQSLYNLTIHPNILSSPSHPAEKEQTCYFTYAPSHPSDHWSVETPLPSPNISTKVTPDPYNPLLAARLPLLTPPQTVEASKFLQLQTMAAHQSTQRPRPQPHQDVFELSDDSASGRSSMSSDSSSSRSRPCVCSRCQTSYGQFVAYSLNSYYCTRCAKIVGYGG